MKTVAIIPAAGAGVRMDADRPKQFIKIDNKPLLALTLEKFQSCHLIDSIILVVPESELISCEEEIVRPFELTKVKKIIAGGGRRQDSVRMGIESIEGECELVLIHDGVRPLVDRQLIENAVKAAYDHPSVITALPMKDTVKEVDDNGLVIRTCERNRLWQVQTPQVFRYNDILSAHRRAIEEDWGDVTDDALLMEMVGVPVMVIQGSETNIKITTKYDMELVKFLIKKDTD